MGKNADSTSMEIFTRIPISIVVIKEKNKAIQQVNPAFENLTGYSEAELLKASKALPDIIYKRDLKKINQRLDCLDNDQYLADEVRISTKKGGGKEVAINISKLKKSLLLCTFRDLSAQKDYERELLDKIKEERSKALDMVKNVICIQQILDRLNLSPGFIRELWKCKDEEELLQKTVHLMCSQNKFAYAYVTILLKEGEFLELKATNKNQALQRFNLNKQHKLAQAFRGEKQFLDENTGEYILPILSPIETEGVMQVFFGEKERILIAENEDIKQGHWNLLECLAEFLGMFIHSLRSTNQESSLAHNTIMDLENNVTDRIAAKENFALFLIGVDHCSPLDNLRSLDSKKQLLNHLETTINNYKATGSDLFGISYSEFFLLIPGDLYKSPTVEAEKLRRKLHQTNVEIGDEHFRMTFSIGVTSYSTGKKKNIASADLMQQAVGCLKAARKAGKNRVYHWSGSPKAVEKNTSKLK